mgnify:FL=1
MTYTQIIKKLKSLSNTKNRQGMARFGIETSKAFGISIPNLRAIAKEVGKDHKLAQQLWNSGYHEARILACFIDDPKEVTEKQLDEWVLGFNSWDLCDQCCSNLIDKTPFAIKKINEWSAREEEFVRRAGIVLMACLAVHAKKMSDSEFEPFFKIIKKYSTDERNFVKKAVNWALRQIGKRNLALNKRAIIVGKSIQTIDSKSAKWIAHDAIRELQSEAVQERLVKKEQK